MKHRFLYFLAIFLSGPVFSQKIVHDWENYVVSLNGKPVSINVDLGLASIAPVREDSFVIILRVKINQLDARGMPTDVEAEQLLKMEDALVTLLARQSGATLAGRFTQRGIREFYFYAPDTLGFRKGVNQSMQPFSDHEWLSQAKKDPKWENYFTVLYPGKLDKFRIESRRNLAELSRAGLLRQGPILADYFFEFQELESIKKFLSSPSMTGFEIISLPNKPGEVNQAFVLVLRKKVEPDYPWIESHLVPLFNDAVKNRGVFLGWQRVLK
ncbi:MAG: DUF695 domain-containing protein [Chitinophagaceae bacterium]|nr:DUF695 domain-containing protein [Chitinophagaceae bacterium]